MLNQPFQGKGPRATELATVADQVAALISRLHPNVAMERRRDDRYPLPVLLELIPLDDDGARCPHELMTVVGKNISRRGISFFHEHPLSHRRVLVELVDNDLGWFAAEVDVTWCRFTKPGWYESGGRLVRVLSCTSGNKTNGHPKAELTQLASEFSGATGSFVAVNRMS